VSGVQVETGTKVMQTKCNSDSTNVGRNTSIEEGKREYERTGGTSSNMIT
jgi:hypothetical protein